MTLREKLEYHYRSFDRSKIEPDPLQFLHLYQESRDIEAIGLISSIFAYGNVTQILGTLNKIISIIGSSPYQFIRNFSIERDSVLFSEIKHRFYTSQDIARLFSVVGEAYNNFLSLNNLFLFGFKMEDDNVGNGIKSFSNYFINSYKKKFGKSTSGFAFMFPSPEKGSACKRMNLFLRWMVRKDELDFGLWNGIEKNKLIIPVDTHIARISRTLKLTSRKNVSWKMAVEITEKLKKLDPVDPIKYDFAICHIGIRKMKL